ncbi:MAG: M20/M25/M40 family metallo-hydrolase [Proteobacteria bacterium]|nr:M20/M25/M40 family metallo-hydrolase [Pseudomonadota bacterium]
MEINRERLAVTFTELCQISSPSRQEGDIAVYLKQAFSALGADAIYEDDSAARTGSESGNLIVRFDGSLPNQEGLFFSCHMDTVEPATGVEVVRNGNIFTSKGDTILGGDDKTGIAAVLELLAILKENNIAHPTLEVVVTTCEEIGLLGAKNLDCSKLRTKYGYALDSTGNNHVIVGAPAANKIKVEIKGMAAHAGLCPEAGINALALAAQALTIIRLGRLDEESTCNFGMIQGGIATNIIPDRVVLRGEVRSHSRDKLVRYTEDIFNVFQRIVADWQGNPATGANRPSVAIEIVDDYPPMAIAEDAPVLMRIKKAAGACCKELRYIVAGGGSDANIFNGAGLPTAIVATGMDKVHTVNEQLDLNDLVNLTELLYALATELQ